MITTTCKKCGRSFKLRDELAGRQGKCKCGAIVDVPRSNEYDLAPTPAASVAGSSYGNAFSPESQQTRPKAADSPVARNDRFPGFDPLEAPRAVSPSVPAADASKGDGQTPKKRSSWIWSLARVAILLIVLGGIIFFAMAYFVFIPQHEKIRQTARETVANAEKSMEMQKKINQMEAEAMEAKSRKALGMDEPEPALPPGLSEGDKAVRRLYIQSCEPFVRQVKSLRARVATGLSLQDYADKLGEVVDEYAQIQRHSTDPEIIECTEAADDVVKQYQDIANLWIAAVEANSLRVYERNIKQAMERADMAAGRLESRFSSLQLSSK